MLLDGLRELVRPRGEQRGKPLYRPMVSEFEEGRYQQEFTAGYVSFDRDATGTTIGFTERPHESVHGLLLSFPSTREFEPGEVELEFNDEGNAAAGTEFAIGISEGALQISLVDDAAMAAGRIDYDASADFLTDDGEVDEVDVHRILVRLAVPDDVIRILEADVESLHGNGVRATLA